MSPSKTLFWMILCSILKGARLEMRTHELMFMPWRNQNLIYSTMSIRVFFFLDGCNIYISENDHCYILTLYSIYNAIKSLNEFLKWNAIITIWSGFIDIKILKKILVHHRKQNVAKNHLIQKKIQLMHCLLL